MIGVNPWGAESVLQPAFRFGQVGRRWRALVLGFWLNPAPEGPVQRVAELSTATLSMSALA